MRAFVSKLKRAVKNIPPVALHDSNLDPCETAAWLQRQLAELDLALNLGPEARGALERLLATAIAMERQRLARVVQDTLVQSLTAVYFTIKVIEVNLRRNGLEIPEEVTLLERLIGRTSTELHATIRELHLAAGVAAPPLEGANVR